MNIKNIPIYIISYNRLSCIKKQIEYFEECNLTNIHIIDNASTYQPLLDYLQKTPYKVYFLIKNYGHEVLFKCADFKNIIANEYFVCTDPDIIPIKECPHDFMAVFYDILQNNSQVNKVGFSLKIDDLPDCYTLKQNVIEWESRFYKNAFEYNNLEIYDAPIDTTFALYRPNKKYHEGKEFFKSIRVGSPYVARHLPWYKDLRKLTDEDVFYNALDKGAGNWNGTLSAEELKKKHQEQIRAKIRIHLFFILPFLTIDRKKNVWKVRLFGFITLGKIKIATKKLK